MIAFDLLYNRLSCPSLLPWIESVSLVERMSGKASTLSVQLCNADGRFLGAWKATRGDSLALSISPATPDVYTITKISSRRAPMVVTWEAEGRPATTGTPKDRGSGSPPPSSGGFVEDRLSWDKPIQGVLLSALALRVCNECGLSLRYAARADPKISYVSRYNETGFHLLTRYCRRFGLVLRATSGTVTILSAQAQADKSPPASVAVPLTEIVTLSESGAIAARSVRSARLDPRTARAVRFSAGDGVGADKDLSYDADDAAALYAEAIASAETASVDIVPRAGIVAGSIVNFDGMGLREVTEMRYTRTGDTERMTLTVRAAR